MPCRSKIPRDYYVTALAQEEVRVFLSTAPSAKMSGNALDKLFSRQPIQPV
jgi:hypothetical protein